MPDRDELKAAIAGLEAQRALLGDSVIEPALTALRKQLAELDARPVESAPAEERKIVTILFVDVSGFTALAETLDPEEVRELVNACFECLVPVVQKYGGTIDKFIGDEVMALFGAPIAHENDPERALRTALEMMEAIVSFNREHRTKLGLHIGVNTGPVVTGAIGSQDRRDYSVMGDAVNLAARLEDASADGEIYVGPGTYRRTTALFDFQALPPLKLKGKSKPVEIYRLLGLKAVPRAGRGIEGLRAELIGRSREMEEMQAAFQDLRKGKGRVVTIVGEAGLGKSRLIAEALSSFALDLPWAEGSALSHTAGVSYWMARDLLRNLVGVRRETDLARSNALLRGSVESVLSTKAADVYPYLARLLDFPLSGEAEERLKFLTSEALQGRILQAFRDYVAAHAQKKALILHWEDLHWCDPSSLRILETLLPLVKEVPLLLLVAYRRDDESVDQLQKQVQRVAPSHCRTIELSPLTREESRVLIQRLLKIENLPEKMRELILDRAEGNPFFVEELLRSLTEAGMITIERDRFVASADIDKVNVPETVQGVLTARVDRLSSENKWTLQNAAVLGRVFQKKLLARLFDEKESGSEQLGISLAELQRREFIELRLLSSPEEPEYIFKHAITQEVVYNSLLRANRKQLHKRAGVALESLFPLRLDDFSATLGYHFQKAEAHERALHYLELAAQRAQLGFANLEAIDLYRSAIAEVATLIEERKGRDEAFSAVAGRLYQELGDLLERIGRHDAARDAYDSAFSFLAERDCVGAARLRRKVGFTYSMQRIYPKATEAFDRAETELGQSPEEGEPESWWKEKLEVTLERMHLLYWQGMADQIDDMAREKRAMVEEKGTPAQHATFFTRLAIAELSRARYAPSEKALAFADLAVKAARGLPELEKRVHPEFVLGFTHLWCGNLPEAAAQLQKAQHLCEKTGDLVNEARCLSYLAVSHRRLHDASETRRTAALTLKLSLELDMPEYVAMAKANLAWLAWSEGHAGDARKLGLEALEGWHGMPDPYGFDWMALLPLTAIALAEDQIEEAVKHVRGLFGENQHPLPPGLINAANQVIEAREKNQRERVTEKVGQLVRVAREIGYI